MDGLRVSHWCRWVGTIVYVFSAAAANAQDACIAILQHGIYDTHAAQASTQTYSAFKHDFCSWYSLYRQTHQSANASLSIPIVDIPIGLSGV